MAVQWGITHEQNAEGESSRFIEDCSCSHLGCFGASPDGLTGDTRVLPVKTTCSEMEQGYMVARMSHKKADLLFLAWSVSSLLQPE